MKNSPIASDMDLKKSIETELLEEHRDKLKEIFPLDDNGLQFKQEHQLHAENLPLNISKKKKQLSKVAKLNGLIAAIIATLFFVDPAYKTESYATAFGERKSIHLADNSQITLNTSSEIVVKTHLRSRRVHQTKGQAYYDVSHHWFKPFYVEAFDATVKVVGTQFDIKHVNHRTTVSVLTGKVSVYDKPNQLDYQLTSNQQLALIGQKTPHVTHVNAASNIAWTDGKLVFENATLAQVVLEMNRYHSEKIIIDARCQSLKVSGVFEIDDVNNILALLPKIIPIKLVTNEAGITYIYPKLNNFND